MKLSLSVSVQSERAHTELLESVVVRVVPAPGLVEDHVAGRDVAAHLQERISILRSGEITLILCLVVILLGAAQQGGGALQLLLLLHHLLLLILGQAQPVHGGVLAAAVPGVVHSHHIPRHRLLVVAGGLPLPVGDELYLVTP